jgi:3-oxoacid CoA-transferase subunit B
VTDLHTAAKGMTDQTPAATGREPPPMKGWTREQMAARAAMEVAEGWQVCLGPGLSTLVANYLPVGVDVVQCEAHRGQNVSGAASYSLGAGEADLAIIEAVQVSARGDIAGTWIAGEGLASVLHAAKRAIVLMEHVAADGSFNVVERCSLRHVGPAAMQRIITDLAVIDVLSGDDAAGTTTRLRLVETAPGVSEGYLRRWTGARIGGSRLSINTATGCW